MIHIRIARHGPARCAGSLLRPVAVRCRFASTAADAPVAEAKAYCVKQLSAFDREAYMIRTFVPRRVQDLYDALRALNLELVRLPEQVSNPTIAQMRMKFWKESIDATFAGRPPREPICILLRKALDDLQERSATASADSNSIKWWISRLMKTRARYMDNRPYPTLASLEEYGENTYSSVMYATLAGLPMASMHLDHLASHIGKACGIVAVLRGIPVLAAPSQPPPGVPGAGISAFNRREPTLLLPLDVMAEEGLSEEEVFRRGPHAEGFQDAVFKVATRANDHLITAREMMASLRAGQGPGHEYEYDHATDADSPLARYTEEDDSTVATDIKRSFGVFLEAIPAAEYLKSLEDKDFNPFEVRANWKLPWRIWRSLANYQI